MWELFLVFLMFWSFSGLFVAVWISELVRKKRLYEPKTPSGYAPYAAICGPIMWGVLLFYSAAVFASSVAKAADEHEESR